LPSACESIGQVWSHLDLTCPKFNLHRKMAVLFPLTASFRWPVRRCIEQ